MEISVVNDLASFKAQSSLDSGAGDLSNALKQLTTARRVNPAAEEPPGLAVSERFRTWIRGLVRASSNAPGGAVQKTPGEGARAGSASLCP